jgi:hypothetical protein
MSYANPHDDDVELLDLPSFTCIKGTVTKRGPKLADTSNLKQEGSSKLLNHHQAKVSVTGNTSGSCTRYEKYPPLFHWIDPTIASVLGRAGVSCEGSPYQFLR